MSAVFLDLDGTLMDSRPGITGSLAHAFALNGMDAHAESDLTWMIGPPFVESFAKLGIADADPILAAYRAHYTASGMYDAEVYGGVIAALQAMRDAGHRLYLMTAKPHAYATKITAHFGLAAFMTAEFGPELDGTRNWKGDLLAYALEQTGETPEASVMVGDRYHDMGAAAEVGMAAIAVRWGYGTPEDWSGAAAFIDHASELPAVAASLLAQGR
ncbi:MAG: HAD hydrolase-like protein [Boseongicola sp.]|nr:HAD hydrolase-like protein [Boseongicola sp.]